MLKNQSRFLTTAVTGLVLIAGISISAQDAKADFLGYSTLAPTQVALAKEKHPELRAALRNLKAAKAELQKGARDFKGERVEALKYTDRAISEVKEALKSDPN
jgi:hypothetical protein